MNVLILTRRPDLYSIRRLEEEFRRAGHFPILRDPEAPDVLKVDCDVVVPRFGVFQFEESLTLLEVFERYKIPAVNRTSSLRDARNKWIAHLLLSEEGLPVPETRLESRKALPKGYPYVAKLADRSQGEGVHLIRGPADLLALPMDPEWVVQEFIAESSGRDRRLFVDRNGLVAAMERRAPEGEFRSNLALGGTATPYEPAQFEVDLAMRALATLQLDVAGVDFLISSRGPLICEVNACPGFEGIERATGKNVGQSYVHAAERLLRRAPHSRPER